MLSALHRTFGEPAEVLTPADAPLPEPKAGEVRIRTILSPIHNHDLWTVRGQYGYKPALPAIGGTEAVGIVDALGPGVTGITTGTRVAAAGVHETWAEYFLAPAKSLVPLPEAIADEAAAQLIAMPFSAITLLDFLGVDTGDWVIQNTANGAVGKTLAMLAAARGIHVVNLVRRDQGVGELESLGIANAVSTASPGWKERVTEITSGAPIRAAVDSIGGDASGDLMHLLGDNGLLVSFGSMAGEPMRIPSGATIFKQAVVKGFWGAKVSADMAPEKRAALIGELMRLVASGELKLPVEAVFGLDRIKDAVLASQAPGKIGKVLLRP
ncbi:Phthiocerol synthesis polyketide synthase type I PpsC [Pleomorphomonas sp. T1.2MG-36]|uniref:zinc-binding dehydrogenase n=1 Tax=Pleomorphomonas sp. T1.2MG-36 TaxID=3041167 RepID=UPI002477328E|nr:zinc-binding dehydrogenase [Pleomorphomonas sp. T1.2MG-36]CAI9403510.1 Phthiocerol synthesis polyketide synthase type I PpsC [Pleomorphomonas sp. T1.2MG-36]